MPRVPIYQGTQVRPQPFSDVQQRVRANVEDHGSGLGLGGLGQGLEELGGGLQASEQRRNREEEEARFLAAQQKADELESQLFDPEAGFLAASGPEAASQREAALKDYESAMESLQAGFESPRLAEFWGPVSASRQAAVRARVAEEGLRQTSDWLLQERGQRVEQRLTHAQANLGNPDALSADLEMLAFDAELLARSQGLDDAESEAFVAEKLAAVHQAVLSDHLSNGRLEEAATYLEEQRETLPEPLAAELDRSLREERQLTEAKGLAEELLAVTPASLGEGGASFEAAQAQVDLIADEETRGLVRRQIETARRAAEAPPPPDPEREQLEIESIEAIRAGSNPDALPLDVRQRLGRDGMGRLRRTFDQGAAVETDWALYGELASLPLEELAARDLFAVSDGLAPEAFSVLRQRQEMARKAGARGGGSPEAARLAASGRRQQRVIDSLGLPPGSPEAGRLRGAIDRALMEAELAKGAALDPQEERRAMQEGALAGLPPPPEPVERDVTARDLDHLRQAMPTLSEEQRLAVVQNLKRNGGL